ncbi:HAD family hydrolase [Lichenifustis flavocetrariae]|uniref:phosphoglycolate phosphatase n=1 Tax=Lichenifustis flavocetrariae TaxID=2949735 RepID=A0AA41YX46_9HYPH|nr:HAD-IA family hydrolase [Lichenifustis flavocetrariae]MCW6508910.1 HAD-IA family hydrolase [Lichenifustis flavocetrariae]
MRMGLAGILFDKDGTFVDFDATWGAATYDVMRLMSGDDGAALDRIAAAMHYDLGTRRFRPTSPLIAGATKDYAHLWAEALRRRHDPALIEEMNRRFADETLRALTPIGRPSDVMAALQRRGLRLGLATNDSEASGRAQVAALGLDAHMEFLAGYDSGHGAKPDPGMVLAFAAYLGVPPESIAMVGDSRHDMTAARAAGAVAVAVLTGPATREDLLSEADHVLDGIEDLPALVDMLART